mgnify:FL=1|uniref:Tyrosine specific protein phosphatases domain-containing protein n=1 Tax=viral metagenome TaxID=1070528 RepID=A0A6C0JD56_9ZZZZ
MTYLERLKNQFYEIYILFYTTVYRTIYRYFGLFITDVIYTVLPKYSLICDNLYISEYSTANDKQFITDNGIKLIINVTKELPFEDPSNGSIEQIRIPVDDDGSPISNEALLKYVQDNNIYDTVTRHLDTKQGVLVHCKSGVQRSPTVVAMILMKKLNIPFNEATRMIQKERYPTFFPFNNFIIALKEYEKILSQTQNNINETG